MEQQKQHVLRTEEQIIALLEEYDRSDFTVRDFCGVSEIGEATFYAWQKKYRPKPEGEVKSFAKIEVSPMIVQSGPQLFAEIRNIKLYKEVPAEYLKTLLS